MQKKVIVAIDSFKGCLSSIEAGEAVALGIRQACPAAETEVIPVADGGEGLLEVLVENSGGRLVKCRVHDPLMRETDACFGLSGDGQTAFVEMARASGLPLLTPKERDPLRATTYGTGELVREALQLGCRQVLIGLGGSATNDAGLGMLQALGYRFLDDQGNGIGLGGQALLRIVHIDDSHVMPEVQTTIFTAACDVRNPLYGPEGAAQIFAPQKGATPQMVATLDEGLRNLAQVIYKYNKVEIGSLPGAGAAGGMGGGLHALLGATLRPGISLVLDMAGFNRRLSDADLVITGEGRADRQTLMGKVPAGILNLASQQNIPVALLAGQVEDTEQLLNAGFHWVYSINPPEISLETALQPNFARARLTDTAERMVRMVFSRKSV